jgi:regulator of sigma E protease
MESVLIKTAQLLLSLSILVILHELGHFMFARVFHTRVEKFYLFFNPWFSVWKKKIGETVYGIGWLPLGGYVKIAGMIDESMDTEQMKQPAQPWEFRSKPAWQRLLIMVGGVVMNFFFAFLIYVGVLYAWGEEYLPTANVKYGIVVDETGEKLGFMNGDKILSVDYKPVENFAKVVPTIVLDKAASVQVERKGEKISIPIADESFALLLKSKGIFGLRYPFKFVIGDFAKHSPGRDAGLLKGDEIISINGQAFGFYDEFQKTLAENKGKAIMIGINRNGESKEIPVTLSNEGLIGITNSYPFQDLFEFKTIRYGFFESIPAGVSRGVETIGNYLKQFKLFFMPKAKAYESLGGFITIGSIFPGSWDWHSFWNMTAFISIILAIMNLLPIPALDGGYVMFLLYEMITRRKPNEKFMEYAVTAGLFLLLALVIFANANDILKLFR